MIQVFVYGTLKPGEANFSRLCRPYTVTYRPATTRGYLYHLPVGYPAMTDGSDWIQGVILSFESPQLLTTLNDLEDYSSDRPPEQNEYQRQLRPVFTTDHHPAGQAWLYLMARDHVKRRHGQYLPQGIWLGSDQSQ